VATEATTCMSRVKADYIIGLGLKIELHRIIDDRQKVVVDRDAPGWKRRISIGIEAFLGRATVDQIEATGLSKRSADFLIKNKEKLLETVAKSSYLDIRGVGLRNWKRLINWIVHHESAKIDTVVTTDIHRLIRLGGSLHGKTGLLKTGASLSGIDQFDPLKEAVAFKDGHLVVDVAEAPEFRMGDRVYGPFKNAAQVELPTAAALFLCCKGAAKVTEQ
jgi:DNA primase small subunit